MHGFWNKDLLSGFKSADPSLADTPQSVMNSLDETYVKVSQFLEMTSTVSEENKISLMQDYLLGSLKNPAMVGKYSTWWENSIYSNGYFHPDTVRLAYL